MGVCGIRVGAQGGGLRYTTCAWPCPMPSGTPAPPHPQDEELDVLTDTDGLVWGLYSHLWKKTHKGLPCPLVNLPHTVRSGSVGSAVPGICRPARPSVPGGEGGGGEGDAVAATHLHATLPHAGGVQERAARGLVLYLPEGQQGGGVKGAQGHTQPLLGNIWPKPRCPRAAAPCPQHTQLGRRPADAHLHSVFTTPLLGPSSQIYRKRKEKLAGQHIWEGIIAGQVRGLLLHPLRGSGGHSSPTSHTAPHPAVHF